MGTGTNHRSLCGDDEMMKFCMGTANIRCRLRIFTDSHAKKVLGDVWGYVGMDGNCGEKMHVFLWGRKNEIFCVGNAWGRPHANFCAWGPSHAFFFVWGGFAWVCDTGVYLTTNHNHSSSVLPW